MRVVPARLIQNQQAVAAIKGFLHRLKKHIHHGCIDPRQKQTDIFASRGIDSTIHVKIRIACLHRGNRPDTFSPPEFPYCWLKPKSPFIKEKYRGIRMGAYPFAKFF